MKDVLRPVLELTVVFPGLLLAYFPVGSYLKLPPAKLAAGAVPLLLGLCLGGGLLCYHFGISTAFSVLLITLTAIFLYRRTLRISLEIRNHRACGLRGICVPEQPVPGRRHGNHDPAAAAAGQAVVLLWHLHLL